VDRLLNYDGAANYLHMSKRHLQRLVRLGLIPHVKLGRAVRFVPDDLAAYVRDRKVSA
jgi:excisionase family DNA binding protein